MKLEARPIQFTNGRARFYGKKVDKFMRYHKKKMFPYGENECDFTFTTQLLHSTI